MKSVRDLGVQLDTELSMKTHVSKVASSCLYQLRRLRQIRRLVGQEVAAQLVSVFILFRLDYCNSVLAGLPRCTTEPLQRVLNAAARLVLNLRPRDHVTPALQQLHWLPIEHRITYKLCLAPRRGARRSLLHCYSIGTAVTVTCGRQPADNTVFTSHAFSSTGPRIRNSLPLLVQTMSLICQHLQTTPQDLSVLDHHYHSLTNRTILADDSKILFHVWCATMAIYTYLLTYLKHFTSGLQHNIIFITVLELQLQLQYMEDK